MAKFSMTFDCDNDAYCIDGKIDEKSIAETIKNVSLLISNGKFSGQIMDKNGNCVGKFDLDMWETEYA